MSERPQLTTAQRRIAGTVTAGAVVIAAIGFAGSYAAVRELALDKGFGAFANVFPIGLDAGIGVLLALDLLLTWLRIPFPLLRHIAWLLTAATIAFNGAAAWPDPIAVGMHAIIPVLFVAIVEAARHATGRIADITADRHMESVRATRWLLAPMPTFRLWRRMKLWELRSYGEVIRLEQERLIYQARLHAQYGRGWRRKAPIEQLLPLRLARYGRPLDHERQDLAAPAPAPAAPAKTTAVNSPTMPDAVAATAVLPPLPQGYAPVTAAPAAHSAAPPRNTAAPGAAPVPAQPICAGPSAVMTLQPPTMRSTAPAAPAPASPQLRPALRTAAPPLRTRPPVPRPASAASAAPAPSPLTRASLTGLTKAAAIRHLHQEDPTASPADIVRLLAAQHIASTAGLVRAELARDRKRRSTAQTDTTARSGTTGFYP